MDENQKQGHIVAILIMIIVLLVGGLVSVLISKTIGKETKLYKETETNNDKKDKKTNEKSEKIETEVSINKYKYLLDRLYPKCIGDIETYLNMEYLDNEARINLAIFSTKSKKINIKNSDEIDMTGCKKEVLEGVTYIVTYKGENIDSENIKEMAGDTYLETDVNNKIKEMFGKNTVITPQTTGDVFYDKTAKAYILTGHGCGVFGTGFIQEIHKITIVENNLYIYTNVGSYADTDDKSKSRICLDYDYNDKKVTCIYRKNMDKKYLLDDSVYDGNFDYEKYFKDNIDKFAKYKYTFEKEDNNYIFKKLEKID